MNILEILLEALGILSILVLILKLIKYLLFRKLTLSGEDLVRYLRSDDHMITIGKCPFCGRYMAVPEESEEHMFSVTCPMCGCTTAEFNSPEEALIAWNLRDGVPTANWEFVNKENLYGK